jgi:hypothetical protein
MSITSILAIIISSITLTGVVFIYFLMKKETFSSENLDRLITLGKWFIGSVAIVLSTAIINDGFREREQDIRDMNYYDKYVSTVTNGDGIEQCWLLTEYFCAVSPPGSMRDSWKRYKNVLFPKYQKYLNYKINYVILDKKENPTPSQESEKLELKQKIIAIDRGFNTEASIATTEWIIIISGDTSLKQAQYESDKAEKLHHTTTIYKKGNTYRTTIGPFKSKKNATVVLFEIKSTLHKNAYLKDFENWCPELVEGEECLECQ